MNAQQKTLTLLIGGAFAASFAAAPVATAAENPFALTPLSAGYMVADHHEMDDKMKEGNCGAGTKESEGKATEGNCSASTEMQEKTKEGSCSGDKGKMKEGSCSSGNS